MIRNRVVASYTDLEEEAGVSIRRVYFFPVYRFLKFLMTLEYSKFEDPLSSSL